MKIIYSAEVKEQLQNIKEFNEKSITILAIYKYIDFDEEEL